MKHLWAAGAVYKEVENFRPLLASWDKSTWPSQVRLKAYLDWLMGEIGPLPEHGPMYLALKVVVPRQDLLRHHDLENYLTPLFGRTRLDPHQFVHATGRKSVGGENRLVIGPARQMETLEEPESWSHLSVLAGKGAQTPRWKARLHEAFSASVGRPLSPGPVEVHLGWRCSPSRNWTMLWKPTGDAMGPVLGASPDRPYNPYDDRIVSIGLHLDADSAMGHNVAVSAWWRLVSEPALTQA